MNLDLSGAKDLGSLTSESGIPTTKARKTGPLSPPYLTFPVAWMKTQTPKFKGGPCHRPRLEMGTLSSVSTLSGQRIAAALPSSQLTRATVFPSFGLEGAPGDHPFVSRASLGPPPTPQMNQGTLGPQVAPLAPGELAETADGVCKFPGQQLSWWQAQESCEQQFGHLALGPPNGILAARLRDPVWVGQREASRRRPPQRRRCVLAPHQLCRVSHEAARKPVCGPETFLTRPVPSEECPTWNPESRTEGSELCLQPRPFLCCYRAETYRRLQEAQSWSGQDVISQVNALANAIVLLPDPLSEVRGTLSLAEASSFLGILERVLAKQAAPLGPGALLAVMHFLKRVTALGAGEPEPLTGPWEQLGQGVMSVASLVLEEQLAGAWLSVSEVVGGPMALVASVQRLAPQLSTMLTSERPRMHIQHRHAGLSGVTVIHSWFTSSVFQHTLGGPGLEPQAPENSKESSRTQRFLSTQVGSAIISSEVWDVTGEVSTAVTFHLQHQTQVLDPLLFSPHPRSPDTGGSWATTGCSVVALYQDSTACFCNHSTNFAILLQVYDIQRGPEEESLLRTLSFVGCGVSFCALATTFLLFLAAGVPKSERTMVHKNLTFALASAEGFLMASEWAKANKVACVAVTAAMHFLFLVAFSWMLVEGLLLWSKVVAVSMRPGPRMRLYYATGWGAPVVIVATTLAICPHDYVATGHCWLNVHTDTIWAFVGPVLFVLTANTCILVRVVMVTVSSACRRARMLSPQPCLQQQIRTQIWAAVKPVLVLLPVLGLTWLVGILAHLSPAWAYAAVGLNSFQGPYIFLVYAAYNGEVRSALQRTTEKAAAALVVPHPGPSSTDARSFQTRCSPAGQGNSPRPPTPWEAAQDGPVALVPPRRLVALREQIGGFLKTGTHGPRIPTAFSSIAETERPAVELTAFKASGARICGNKRAAPLRSSDSAFVSDEWVRC
ncbi:PREDICTED: probable G-protein coupled receptor 144 [Galeopterus variegatus]|uniref:Probable G-protein coupled receptor 144 n=1 Tax=Galeopterus variegatus TaxID=482537 RepID=A0ABM0QD12_GALVR|nr:PREDICTED: probable G-protein coupled receptor 144 [Galeopterus variegatus]